MKQAFATQKKFADDKILCQAGAFFIEGDIFLFLKNSLAFGDVERAKKKSEEIRQMTSFSSRRKNPWRLRSE